MAVCYGSLFAFGIIQIQVTHWLICRMELYVCVKIAGSKSTAKASDVNTKISKQPKAGKAALKKDVTQVNPPAASDKKTDERLPDKDRKKDVPQPRMQFDDVHRVVKAKKRSVVNQSEARNRVELFRHLPQYAHGTQLPELESKFFQPDLMHPSVYKVIINYHVANVL
jgi:translation initiation factor eIF-2B subunit delta